MEEVEALLALAAAPAALTVDEICERLRLPAGSMSDVSLQRLVSAGLATMETIGGAPAYRYEPASTELRQAVDLLRTAYNERPVTLVRLVYNRPSAAQSFADAFRIKREGR